MKIDIPYYIRQVLREQRAVYVPELGTFSLVQTPASFSGDRSTIYPPHLNITFNDSSSTDDSLITYIKDTGLFQEKKINKELAQFSQNALGKLIDANEFVIDKLGKLSKQKDNESVSFSPTVREMTDEFKGLISIPMLPINRIKEKDVVAHVVDTSDIKARPEESSPWWHPLLAGIIVAGLFIFGMNRIQNNQPDTTSETSEVATEEENSDETSNTKQILQEEIDQKYKEVDQLIDPSTELETKPKDNVTEVEVGGIEKIDQVKDDASNEKLAEELSNLTEEKGIASKEEEVSATDSSDRQSDNSITDVDESFNKQGPKGFNIPSSGQCIIILGSFKKASNVTKMISKIERTGKKVFTSQNNGRTRVGFTFDCTEVDLAEYLNDVRDSLSKKAWYLDPSLAVPYR